VSRTPFIISAYPLSRPYREAVEAEVGTAAEYLALPELRRLGARTLVARLRDLDGRPGILAFEDPASLAVLPILHAVAAVATPASLETLGPSLERTRLPYRQLVPEIAGAGGATWSCLAATAQTAAELKRLERLPRQRAPLAHHRRLLYVNANLWFGLKAGGSVGHVTGVANGFAETGYGVDMFTATEPELLRPDVRVSRLTPPRTFGFPYELNIQVFQRLAVADVLSRARPPYDFVYQRLSVGSHAGVRLARRLRTPLVLEYNGSEVWAARQWGRPLRFERLAQAAEDVSIRHAHVVVTVSEVLKDELLERGVDAHRIACYPNCVDPRQYDPTRFDREDLRRLRARYGIADDCVVVTFIGTFGQWHGAEVFARAIAQLAADELDWLRRNRVHFMFVGDGLMMPKVRDAVDTATARPFTTLTGLVPQIEGAAYLAASDILVSPHVPNRDGSRFFGSPTKLFEYMAMGRSILASDLAQIGEVLDPALRADALPQGPPAESDDHLAVLARPGDVDELKRGLRFLVEEEAWRVSLGRRAREQALERFTWRHHVEAILATLEGIGRNGG
jgi:glycosyltransferase involved in cell wall biosynthesis